MHKIHFGIALVRQFFQSKSIDIFLSSPRKHMLWYLLEAPLWGASNEYPQHMFSWRNKKILTWYPLLSRPIILVLKLHKWSKIITFFWSDGYIEVLLKEVFENLDPIVQNVVSLTSSLRVISLTGLADSIHNILIFFAEKMWVAFAMQKLLTFFQQKISAYLRITWCKF